MTGFADFARQVYCTNAGPDVFAEQAARHRRWAAVFEAGADGGGTVFAEACSDAADAHGRVAGLYEALAAASKPAGAGR